MCLKLHWPNELLVPCLELADGAPLCVSVRTRLPEILVVTLKSPLACFAVGSV